MSSACESASKPPATHSLQAQRHGREFSIRTSVFMASPSHLTYPKVRKPTQSVNNDPLSVETFPCAKLLSGPVRPETVRGEIVIRGTLPPNCSVDCQVDVCSLYYQEHSCHAFISESLFRDFDKMFARIIRIVGGVHIYTTSSDEFDCPMYPPCNLTT